MNQEELKGGLRYDRNTGYFTWIKAGRNNCLSGKVAGHKTAQGYVIICIGPEKKRIMAHRLAWLYEHGEMPVDQIDHINMDKSDNRISNLRVVDSAGNRHNREKQSNNTSGVKGVYWHKKTGKWQANIMTHGRRIALGYFHDLEDARRARIEAERIYHPTFLHQ